MPTPLDRVTQSRGAFFAFAGLVTAATAWVIWGGDMFPAEPDPTGDPSTWSAAELRRWLRNVLSTASAGSFCPLQLTLA
ncbi:hypothetical protein BKCO1_520005 [Neofusicoccum parvum]|uniref:Uncharacterized protein n=1 Tax=Neofusicoccum parvum TaxID=310453 RepID=A0ACB5S6Q9_9PEZI|nr:hypothetical protein BKCO1_520005 [Neofusicoccum parvum]